MLDAAWLADRFHTENTDMFGLFVFLSKSIALVAPASFVSIKKFIFFIDAMSDFTS